MLRKGQPSGKNIAAKTAAPGISNRLGGSAVFRPPLRWAPIGQHFANSTRDRKLEPAVSDPREILESIRQCWFLTGATATGKSRLSLNLAQQLDAEIVSLDSMAIYREMDLGTAKPTPEVRRQVAHHLIDILSPTQSFSVSQYRQAALETIDQIRSRGKQVLFVGGTALYLKGLIKGIFDGPPADWDFRQAIEDEVQEAGPKILHQRLQMVDPLSAAKLHPNDSRRIIRALEVLHLTGQPISHQQREFELNLQPQQCRVFWLHRPRTVLHDRIENRVDQMFRLGLVDEVQGLLDRYGNLSHSANQAVGYKEVIRHLQEHVSLEETIDQVKIRTRRFARAQETWFRNMPENRRIDIQEDFDPEALAAQLVAAGQTLAPLN